MVFGKREYMIVGITLVVVIAAGLHFVIFSPQSSAMERIQAEYGETLTKYQALTKSPSDEVLDNYTSATQVYLKELSTGINELGLERLPVFQDPTPEELAQGVEPGMDQATVEKIQYDNLMRVVGQHLKDQVTMIEDAVSTLAQRQSTQALRFTFLGPQKWDLPTQLPARIRPPQLWDLLAVIKDTQGKLDLLPEGSDSRRAAQDYMDNLLRQIGWDPAKLPAIKQYGADVELYYKMQFVNLIMAQANNELVLIGSDRLDRENLLKWLGIKPPTDRLEGIEENKSYFTLMTIRELNRMLNILTELTPPDGVYVDVSDVRLWGFSFLRKEWATPQQPSLDPVDPDKPDPKAPEKPLLPDDRQLAYNHFQTEVAATGDEGMFGFGDGTGLPMMGEGMSEMDMFMMMMGGDGSATGETVEPVKEGVIEKTDEDIGYALPIEMTFQAPNQIGWKFIYEVLRRNPMAELYRLETRSMSIENPNNVNVEFNPTFIMVPELFETVKNVKQVVDELKNTGSDGVTTGTTAAEMPAVPGAGQ